MQARKLAAALAIAAALGFLTALLVPAPAEALPPCGWHADYYSYSSPSWKIGERWVTIESCGCVYDGWGTTAGRIEVVDEPICSIE